MSADDQNIEICCSECEQTNVMNKNDHFECQSCHEIFSGIYQCEYCGHYYSADQEIEGTYFRGCCQCDGKDLSKD
ncbi:Uncharacterised protein [Legionella beliardensis]|uniref:Uncharacterized protein n=1 Tax=Legionella beliardensis TaxID=91822 RepID=A0A378HXI8_9GAMM|nr:hypothetical protein [Legionella beliardensis]STX27532.1 Uncharacterised protein [Legionella beliardensis]